MKMLSVLLCVAIPLGTAPVSQQVGPGNGPNQFNFRTKLFGSGVTNPTVPESGTNNLLSLSYPSPITGKVGVALSASPATTGTQGSVGFEIASGIMPPDLDLDPATGTILGYPAAAGSYGPVTVRLTNGDGAATTGTATFQIVQPAISYPPTTTVAQNANVTIAPTQSHISATNFTLIGSSPPAGMNFDAATGVFSGAPTNAGIHPINMVHASAPDGSVAFSSSFQIVVTAPAATASAAMASLSGQVGTFLAGTPTSSGFAVAPTWTLSPAAPFGLSFDPSSGTLSGTPTSAGSANGLTLTASGGGQSATATFNVSVAAAPVQTATAAMATPIAGTVGTPLSATPSSTGFSASPTWALSAGTLPAGLGVNAATGAITGTPTAAGNAGGLVLTATAGAQSAQTNAFSINVATAPVTATAAMATPVAAQVGSSLTATPTSTGFSAAPTWALTAGTLPAGLSVNAATGTVSGTPQAGTEGTASGLVLTATAGAQTAQTNAFSIVVGPAPATSTLAVSYSPLTTTRNVPVTLSPSTSGAVGGVTYARTSGTLPTGMSLNASTGAIEGTPTVAATYPNIVIAATDSQRTAQSPAFAITVANASATTPGAQTANGGAPFTSTAPTTNVPSPTWTIGSGSLPSGLALDPSTGVISGTIPAGSGNFTVSLTATGGGVSASTGSFTTTVRNIAGPGSGSFSQGNNGSYTYTIPGLTGTPTWSVVGGSLPSGLTLNPSTGVLSGTPTGYGSQPPFTIGVSTSTGFTAVAPPTTLNFAPMFTAAPDQTWTVGQFHSVITMGFSGAAPSPNPWTYELLEGQLPPGVYRGNQLNASLTGTPWQAGSFPGIRFRATNGNTGVTIDSQPLNITVAPAPGTPLAIKQYENGFVVRARGYQSYLVPELDASEPDVNAVYNGVKTYLVRPMATADEQGFVNGWSGGINQAPWEALSRTDAGYAYGYSTGSDRTRFATIFYSAAHTKVGIYPNLSFIVSDTNGGTLTGGRTGRAGVLGPFTLKVFDAWPTAWNNSSSVPASIAPASGTLLTAGMSGDMDFTFDVYGMRATINCTPGEVASFRVHSLLPDGTWTRMMTRTNKTCLAQRYYEEIIDSGMAGIGQKFRVTVDAGQIRWSGGKIDSMGATRAN